MHKIICYNIKIICYFRVIIGESLTLDQAEKKSIKYCHNIVEFFFENIKINIEYHRAIINNKKMNLTKEFEHRKLLCDRHQYLQQYNEEK